jgi:hypothetical protein
VKEEGLEQKVLRDDWIDPSSEACIDELLGRMPLAEKAGRLVQVTTPEQNVLCEECAHDA